MNFKTSIIWKLSHMNVLYKYQCLIQFHPTRSYFLFSLSRSLGFHRGHGHGSESVELFLSKASGTTGPYNDNGRYFFYLLFKQASQLCSIISVRRVTSNQVNLCILFYSKHEKTRSRAMLIKKLENLSLRKFPKAIFCHFQENQSQW